MSLACEIRGSLLGGGSACKCLSRHRLLVFYYFRGDRDDFWDHIEVFHMKISLIRALLLLPVILLNGFTFDIDGYIPYVKYQLKLHTSPCFLSAFAAGVAFRTRFLLLYQRINLGFESVKFTYSYKQGSLSSLNTQDF